MKNWKAILGVCLIFTLGGVAGSLLTVHIITKRIQRIVLGGPQAVNQIVVKRLTKRLDLDADQSGKLMDIIVGARKEIRTARVQIAPQLKQIMDDSESKVRAMLKPEQQKKFDEVLENNKERLARFEGSGT
jgi:hypothetical protein